MDLSQARLDLARVLEDGDVADRLSAARQFLIRHGVAALRIDQSAALTLADILRRGASAPGGPARRAFALLIVHALAVEGLVEAPSQRARLDRDLCAFLDSALPDILRRAGYPFDAELDQRRRVLERLHASLDELTRPIDPTFPAWLNGLEPWRGA